MHFDLSQIIETVGYLGLFAIVFAESGRFFGFFLPGDSLLLTAGLLASQGKLDVAMLLIIGQSIPDIDRYFLAVVAAVIAVSALPTLIHLGKEYGPRLRRCLTARFATGWSKLDSDRIS